MKDPAGTFHWIVGILRARDVPFVVAGGLAARSYGCTRPLADIDIDIHTADFPAILGDIGPRLTFGPARYVDDHWDLTLATLDCDGQQIDICGADSTRIFDSREQIWTKCPTEVSNAVQRDIFGLTVPVLPPGDLIAYKAILRRDVDLEDIAAVKKFMEAA